MPDKVEFEVKDERSATVPVPCSANQLQQLGIWANESAQEGFGLKSAVTISGGDQRDPYVVGIRLVLTRFA